MDPAPTSKSQTSKPRASKPRASKPRLTPRRALRLAFLLLVLGGLIVVSVELERQAPEPIAVARPDEQATQGWERLVGESGVEPWTGDLDGMIERGMIRALVPYSRTFFFLDGGEPRGFSYEHLASFEDALNVAVGRTVLRVPVIFIPTPRDRLLRGLLAGRGDIAAANLTITEERLEHVDFSLPLTSDVRELIVTGPSAPPIETLHDLAGERVYVRRSSSYYTSLQKLNEELEAAELEPVRIVTVHEFLEDSDLVEMVHAGLLGLTVIDSHKAELWGEILDRVEVREDLVLAADRSIGWAFRKESPELARQINAYISTHRTGTLHGNVLFNRYLRDNPWVRNATGEEALAKLGDVARLLRRYSGRYGVDWLLAAALAYQESRLDHSQKSSKGAVGLMQIRPATARDPHIGIQDVSSLEANIHAGIKYFAFLRDRYFSQPSMSERNRTMFTLAAYNAGPRRIALLRREARRLGLDPDVWPGNVEVVAAREIGSETVGYVNNVMKYHLAYRLSRHRLDVRREILAEI